MLYNLLRIRSHLLDRVSSVIESARTLSSNKLFCSRVRQGNVADLAAEEQQVELSETLNVRRWEYVDGESVCESLNEADFSNRLGVLSLNESVVSSDSTSNDCLKF